MFRIRTHKQHLLHSESGVSALEFALIAPVFLLMISGIVEFSLIMFTSTVMESATNTTSRTGKTGYSAAGRTRDQEIRAAVNSRTSGLLDPAKLTIETEVYANFGNINQPEPCIRPPAGPCNGVAGVDFVDVNGNGTWDQDMGAAGLGNAGDVVVYVVRYPWPVMTPMVNHIIGGIYTITARSVVRNEPFGLGMAR